MKPKKSQADRFRQYMTEYCVFPLPVFLRDGIKGKKEAATKELTWEEEEETKEEEPKVIDFLNIQEGLVVLYEGHYVDLFEYIQECVRWQSDEEAGEPLTARKAMELMTVAYYDWAGHSMWDMYTRFPLYMAYASYTEEQWECRERLSGIKPHSFLYREKTVTLQENRLFSVDTYINMTGADVIQYIRGKTVSERGAHRRLFPS